MGSIHRIAASADGKVFIKFLEENLSATDVDNRILEGVNLSRSQGKALTIEAILALLEAIKQ